MLASATPSGAAPLLTLCGMREAFGASLALDGMGLSVVASEPGSPWVASVATNPAVVGQVSIRAAALALAGQDPGQRIIVQPTLRTRAALREAGVGTVDDLNARVPAFGHSDAATRVLDPGAEVMSRGAADGSGVV